MPKTCLTKDEIKELSKLLEKTFAYIKELKSKNPLAEKIQFPKIPPILSESIIINLIRKNKILKELGSIVDVNFGGRKADIIVKTKANNEFKIEVKATGKSAFEYFGEKDISSNYLIWIHFEDFFLDLNKQTADIFIVKNPSQYFNEPIKITLNKLKDEIGEKLSIFKLNIDEL